MKKLLSLLGLLSLAACSLPTQEPERPLEFTLIGQVEGCNVYTFETGTSNRGVMPICKTDIVVDPLAKEQDPQIPTWEPVPNRGSK